MATFRQSSTANGRTRCASVVFWSYQVTLILFLLFGPHFEVQERTRLFGKFEFARFEVVDIIGKKAI